MKLAARCKEEERETERERGLAHSALLLCTSAESDKVFSSSACVAETTGAALPYDRIVVEVWDMTYIAGLLCW